MHTIWRTKKWKAKEGQTKNKRFQIKNAEFTKKILGHRPCKIS